MRARLRASRRWHTQVLLQRLQNSAFREIRNRSTPEVDDTRVGSMLKELQHALCVSRFAAGCRQQQWCVASAALSVQWRPRCKEQADAGAVTSAAKWLRVEQIREHGHP